MEDSHLYCPVCNDKYQNEAEKFPYILYCQHSLCEKDLRTLMMENQDDTVNPTINCPTCSERIALKHYQDGFPPKNSMLLEYLLDEERKVSIPVVSHSLQSDRCQNCKVGTATFYCQNCTAFLCLHCDHLIHSHIILQSHHRMSIESQTLPITSQVTSTKDTCSLHPSEKIRCYCLDDACSTAPFLCVICTIQPQHRQHSIIPIEEAFERLKQQFLTEEFVLSQQLALTFQSFQQEVLVTQQTNATIVADSRVALQQDFAYLRVLLNKFEQKYLTHLDQEAQHNAEQMISLQIAMAGLNQELLLLSHRIQTLLETSQGLAFLQDRIMIKQRILDLQQRMNTFLDQTIIPRQLAIYERQETLPVLSSPEIGALLSHSTGENNEILEKKEASLSPLLSSSLVPLSANHEDPRPKEGELEQSSSLVLGSIATTVITTLTQIDQSIPFYPSLVVTTLLELEPKEVHCYANITIKSQGVLTVTGWDGETLHSGLLYLMIQGSLLIEAGGSINLVGKGYRGGNGSVRKESVAEPGEAPEDESGGKGGHGGALYGTIGGGGGGFMTEGKPAKANTWGGQSFFGGYGGRAISMDSSESIEACLRMGSGGGGGGGHVDFTTGEGSSGGKGGNGGGLLLIEASEVRNFGRITVNGENGGDGNCQNSYISGGGGGSGGGLKITCQTLVNHGSITATGGTGGVATFVETSPQNNCSNGGRGGDGLIVLHYQTIRQSSTAEISPIPQAVNF